MLAFLLLENYLQISSFLKEALAATDTRINKKRGNACITSQP